MHWTDSPAHRFGEMWGKFVLAYTKPESDSSIECAEPPKDFADLVAYRGDGWAICAYRNPPDAQKAFDQVASCFPDADFPHGLGPRSMQLTFLPAMLDGGPTGMIGYVTLKRKNA